MFAAPSTSDCERQRLGAFLDDELSASERLLVEEHVSGCRSCAAELRELKGAHELLSRVPLGDLSLRELADLHAAIDNVGEQRVWRLGGTLSLVAASVLIVGLAWLREIPRPVAAGDVAVAPAARPAAWEQVAMTLREDPSALEPDSSAQVADATHVADWMLQALQR